MKDFYEKINCEIPKKYMKRICEKYNLKCVKLFRATALIGDGYGLIISIGMFDVYVSYVQKQGEECLEFSCDNYFAERYDDADRVNLLEGEGDVYVRNALTIVANGLESKWSDVLAGDTKWLEDYKKSRWYEVRKLPENDMKKIRKYI